MNRAITKVRKIIRKPRTHRGRIRLLSAGLVTVCLFLLAVLWLPGALADYTSSAISNAKSREIGAKLMPYINQYAGRPCQSASATPIVRKLEDRLIGTDHNTLFIADLGARYSIHLPGGIILANQVLVEDYSNAEVLAGFVLMEKTLQEERPILRELFLDSGSIATIKFLVTGEIDGSVLQKFAKDQITGRLIRPGFDSLLGNIKAANVSSTPFANALDSQLTTTQALVDGDPVQAPYEPILSDPEFLALQSICEG